MNGVFLGVVVAWDCKDARTVELYKINYYYLDAILFSMALWVLSQILNSPD